MVSVNGTNWNEMTDDAFRAEVARFIEGHCPAVLRYLKDRPRLAQVLDWQKAMGKAGWLCPAWPVEYGGMGLSPAKQLIYLEEMENLGAPRLLDQGMINFGPLLIAHGTEAQKAEYLPKIISCEHIWCQGYSEPNAGSDLASLKTEAVLDGDEFVINGSKIWTSMAMDANMIFALVRTDKTVRKQAGISFVLIDLKQPGVTVRTIENIAGREELCEVFFDNVRTPKENLVGALNDGWRLSKTLLGHERIWSGSPRQSFSALFNLRRIAEALGKFDDPVFADKYQMLELDTRDLGSAYALVQQKVVRGESLGAEVSILKIWATENCQRITETLLEAAQDAGGLSGDVTIGDLEIDIAMPFFDSRAPTIYGGSSQVQRNIIAKTVLNLPRSS